MISQESPDCFMLDGIKCLLKVYRCHPHVRLPLSAFLGDEFVRHKVACCLECFSESRLIGTQVPVKHGAKPVVQHRGNEFVNLWKTTDRSVILWFCGVVFLADHCDHNFLHELKAMEIRLRIKLKISCIFLVSSSAPLRSSACMATSVFKSCFAVLLVYSFIVLM